MLNIITSLILVSLAILCLRVYKRPGIAATLVWSMIVTESVIQQGNSYLLEHSSLINFLIAGIAGFAASWAIITGKYKGINIPAQVWIYAGLILMCALSYFWSQSPERTLDHLVENLPYIIAFGFLAPMCIFDEKQLNAAIKVLIYFGGLVVIGVNFSTQGYRGIVLTTEKGIAIEANPLAAASFAGYVAFACLFSIWGTKLFSFKSILKSAILVACIIAIINSGSRGQLIAFVTISILLFPIMARAALHRSTVLTGIGAVLLSAFVIYMVDQLGWAERWNYERLLADQQDRLRLSQFMLETNLREGPIAWLFGLGSSSSFKIVGGYPHNTFAETLAEEGLIGFFLLCWIVGLTVWQGMKLIRSDAFSRQTRVNLSIIFAIFCFNIILSLKEGSLLGSAISIFSTGLTLAWLYSRLHRKAKQKHVEIRRVKQPAGAFAANPRTPHSDGRRISQKSV